MFLPQFFIDKKLIYLFIFFVFNSLFLVFVPKIAIQNFGLETYSLFVLFNAYVEIVSKFSLLSIADLSLKIKKNFTFIRNLRYIFVFNIILYLISAFFIFLFFELKWTFKILIFCNIVIIAQRYLNGIFFYENKINKINFYSLASSAILMTILLIFFLLNINSNYCLIIAYTLSSAIIVVINISSLKFLFELKKYKNIFLNIKLIIKNNIVFILYDFLKSIYFPILVLLVTYLSVNESKNNLLSAIGISTSFTFFAGHLIARTYLKFYIKNIESYNKSFFYKLSFLGTLFFLILYFIGREHIKNFYFINGNAQFEFIFLIFTLFGLFSFFGELNLHVAITKDRMKFYFLAVIFNIFFLLINLFLKKILDYNLHSFFVIALISYVFCQVYSLYQTLK